MDSLGLCDSLVVLFPCGFNRPLLSPCGVIPLWIQKAFVVPLWCYSLVDSISLCDSLVVLFPCGFNRPLLFPCGVIPLWIQKTLVVSATHGRNSAQLLALHTHTLSHACSSLINASSECSLTFAAQHLCRMEPLDLDDKSHEVLWHGSPITRLRLVSFVAEAFWKRAFKEREGMNALSAASVQKVLLSDVSVDSQKPEDREVKVKGKDAAIALSVAEAVVRRLEDLGYRILDAVVPGEEVSEDGRYREHDLVLERRGLDKKTSAEVKCKTILKPEKLRKKAMQEVRQDALHLWRPASYSERLIVLLEYPGYCLETGWRWMHIERYSASGEWESLGEFPGAALQSMGSPASAAGRKRQRQRASTPTTSLKQPCRSTGHVAVNCKFVLVGGQKYVTLAWYLGRPSVKSEWQVAARSCSADRVEYRFGDYKSFSKALGQEILEEDALASLNSHRWVDTCVAQPRAERRALQVRLLRDGKAPAAESKFLWNWGELARCSSLNK